GAPYRGSAPRPGGAEGSHSKERPARAEILQHQREKVPGTEPEGKAENHERRRDAGSARFRRHVDQKAHRHRWQSRHRRLPGRAVRGDMGAGGIINVLNGEAAEQRPGAEAAHRLVSSPGPSTDRQPARLTVFFLPYLHKLEEKERGDGAIAGWMTPPKTAAQYLVEQLIAWSCRTVYGVAGDDNLFLLDALEKQRAIRYIACRLEITAALMASAEAKLTGRPAVCTATAGPGAALLAAGLGDAAMDRAPVLAITGQ